MRIYENERVNSWVFGQMRDRLARDRTNDPWHASEVFGCPRKAILNRVFPPILTQSDILYFTRGYAIQEYMFGEEEEGEEWEGVILSPDHIEGEHLFEIKTTNLWYETQSKGRFDPTNMSDWIERTKTYAAVRGMKNAHITVVFLNGKQGMEMHTWTLEFEPGELEEAKGNLLSRRDRLDQGWADYQDRGELPSVIERTYERECGYCPNLSRCLGELNALGLSVEKK